MGVKRVLGTELLEEKALQKVYNCTVVVFELPTLTSY
jgi:hypothetical protein